MRMAGLYDLTPKSAVHRRRVRVAIFEDEAQLLQPGDPQQKPRKVRYCK